MDTPAINGLPPIPPTLRVGRTRDRQQQGNRRRFEDAFEEGTADDTPREAEDAATRSLQNRGASVRRDEGPQDGHLHVDVMA